MKIVENEVSDLKTKIRSMNIKSNYQTPVPEPVVKKEKPKMPATKLKKNAQ